MNKTDIIKTVAEEANISQRAAAAALDSLVKLIKDRAAHGQETRLHGFGTFTVKNRVARIVKNPQTREPMAIPAKNVLNFKPTRTTADYLN